jgi:outer membrane protein OmpA-like peptidoglycan-associated protein
MVQRALAHPVWRWRVVSLLALLAAATLFFPAPAVHAQATVPAGEGLRSEAFQPAAGPRDGLAVPSADVPGHLQPAGGFLIHYSKNPLIYETRSGQLLYKSIVEERVAADLYLSLGLVDRFELSLVLPVALYQEGGGSALEVMEDLAPLGLGDLRVGLKGLLWRAANRAFALSASMDLTTPTGAADEFLGEGSTTWAPGLILSWWPSRWVRGGLQLAYRFREDRTFLNLELRDEILYRTGLDLVLEPKTLELTGELFGALRADAPFADQDVSPLELLVGTRYWMWRDLAATFGFGVGLVKGYGTPEYRVAAGLAWAPLDSDRDGDGILDLDDQCPDQPEDKDGFQDADGCPDPDNDGDGLPDGQDQCPDQPEDLDGFQDEDGCPDPDNDGDGILDVDDGCPNEAEDKDGFRDEDGCPDPDNDGDGILDGDDKCPDAAEDKDGFQDADGCPDPDNDGDRILDPVDRCPNEPEVYNGLEDEDGCPDETRVRVEKGKITILEMIFFEFNKDVIKPVSFGILDEVAGTLRANPQIKLVRVEGHTDSVGNDKYNRDLSQRRAMAVMRHLVNAGIEPARLIAQGFGEDRPIDSNETAEGRGRNRRVDFIILEEQ